MEEEFETWWKNYFQYSLIIEDLDIHDKSQAKLIPGKIKLKDLIRKLNEDVKLIERETRLDQFDIKKIILKSKKKAKNGMILFSPDLLDIIQEVTSQSHDIKKRLFENLCSANLILADVSERSVPIESYNRRGIILGGHVSRSAQTSSSSESSDDEVEVDGIHKKSHDRIVISKLNDFINETGLFDDDKTRKKILEIIEERFNDYISYNELVKIVKEVDCDKYEKEIKSIKDLIYSQKLRFCPPPILSIMISIILIICFVEFVYKSSIQLKESKLIFDPNKKNEAWRYISYCLLHADIQHLLTNVILQLLVGIPLEMEQRGYGRYIQVGLIYLAGVLGGSIGVSVLNSDEYLCGASAGVYAITFAHLVSVIYNWKEDNVKLFNGWKKSRTSYMKLFQCIRCVIIAIVVAGDIGTKIKGESETSFYGHGCGSLSGILVGLCLIDNRRKRHHDKYIHWGGIFIYLISIISCILYTILKEKYQ